MMGSNGDDWCKDYVPGNILKDGHKPGLALLAFFGDCQYGWHSAADMEDFEKFYDARRTEKATTKKIRDVGALDVLG